MDCVIESGVLALQTLATRLNIIAQHSVCADSRLTEDGWRKSMELT